MKGRRIFVIGLILSSLLSLGALALHYGAGSPPLNKEAERLQRELALEIPIGSDASVVEDAFRRRGWNAKFDPILSNYGFSIKRGRDTISVDIRMNGSKVVKKVEVKALYFPGLG